jgi:hypothetical protein
MKDWVKRADLEAKRHSNFRKAPVKQVLTGKMARF